MADIPAAREILATALPGMPEPWRSQVEAALTLMHREPPAKPRAPASKAPIDADTAAAIRAHVARYPRAQLHDVANKFRTNIGRVSEALHGKR